MFIWPEWLLVNNASNNKLKTYGNEIQYMEYNMEAGCII